MFIELTRVFKDHTQKVIINITRIIHFSNDGITMENGVHLRVKEDGNEILAMIEYKKQRRIIK